MCCAGSVIFNVYDEDVGSDTFVGSTQLNLDLAFKDRQPYAELKLELKDKYLKQGKNSRITVALGGCIASYSLLRNVFGHTPGILFNDAKERLYFPIAETQGAVYLGIEYEHDWRNKLVGEVDVKAYITRPDVAIFVDMAIAGAVWGQLCEIDHLLRSLQRWTYMHALMHAGHAA